MATSTNGKTHASTRRRRPKDLTLADLRASAEKLARQAGLPGAAKAFKLLDDGKLDGTILESELEAIRFLARGRELTNA